MPANICGYSKSALENRGENVENYEIHMNHGVTEIKYDTLSQEGAALGGRRISNRHYFCSSSGEFLGNSENEASDFANAKGLNYTALQNFSEAYKWFRKADYTCTSDDPKENEYKNNVDTTYLASIAQQLSSEGRLLEAKAKIQEANNKSNVQDVKIKIQIEKENIEAKISSSASAAFHEGQQKWDEAWQAEESENYQLAEFYFTAAWSLFKQACELEPDNLQYKRSLDVADLNMEENSHFNEGIQLEREGTSIANSTLEIPTLALELKKYQSALSNYQQAKEIFMTAYRTSGDDRFNSCVAIVDDQMFVVTETINNLERQSIKSARRKLFFKVQ